MDIAMTPRPGAEWLTDPEPGPDDDQGAHLHERMVHSKLRDLRVTDDARRRYDLERRGPAEPFDLDTLAAVLARPASPPARVDDLIPWAAGTLLTAQRKTGKTTTVLNLARCLLTGEDFLGRFGVRPVAGTVALLNYEVSAAQVARWAYEVGVPADRLLLVNLRGRRNPLSDAEDRARLASALRARDVESMIVDPFGRAYVGGSQNDAGEVGAFLSQLDTFARSEVGALDLVLTAHAGWNGERTRGSSALEDWADSVLTLTRDTGDDDTEGDGARYLRAIGRDVDVDEDRLTFDPATRLLSLSGAGSRKSARDDRKLDTLAASLLATITTAPGLGANELERRLKADGVPFQKGDVAKAARRLEMSGQIRRDDGPRGAKLHHPASETPTTPDYPRLPPPGAVLTTPDRPYRSGGSQRGHSEDDYPRPCQVCSLPMTVVEPGQTTHPGCDPR